MPCPFCLNPAAKITHLYLNVAGHAVDTWRLAKPALQHLPQPRAEALQPMSAEVRQLRQCCQTLQAGVCCAIGRTVRAQAQLTEVGQQGHNRSIKIVGVRYGEVCEAGKLLQRKRWFL